MRLPPKGRERVGPEELLCHARATSDHTRHAGDSRARVRLCACTCGEQKGSRLKTTCQDQRDLTVHSTPRSLSVILRGTICYEASRVSAVAEETPYVRTEKKKAMRLPAKRGRERVGPEELLCIACAGE